MFPFKEKGQEFRSLLQTMWFYTLSQLHLKKNICFFAKKTEIFITLKLGL